MSLEMSSGREITHSSSSSSHLAVFEESYYMHSDEEDNDDYVLDSHLDTFISGTKRNTDPAVAGETSASGSGIDANLSWSDSKLFSVLLDSKKRPELSVDEVFTETSESSDEEEEDSENPGVVASSSEKQECVKSNRKRSCRDRNPYDRPSKKRKPERRISKQCPIPECSSSKMFVKLPNHFDAVHPNLSKEKRAEYLALAREISRKERELTDGGLTLAEQSLQVTPNPKANIPRSKSTRGWGQFDHDHQELKQFREFLRSIDGGCKSASQARAISVDVSKYLYFANCEVLNWACLLNKQKIVDFLHLLEESGANGADGRVQKLERIIDAIRYRQGNLGIDKHMDHIAMERVLNRLKPWLKTLRKEREILREARLRTRSNSIPTLTFKDVEQALSCEKMWKFFNDVVERARKGEDIDEKDLKLATGAAMLPLLMQSWQRPGAIINCTIGEWEDRHIHGDTVIISVLKHKTSIPHGAAEVAIDKEHTLKIDNYLQYIRPLVASGLRKGIGKTSRDVPLFIKADKTGEKLDGVYNLQQSLAKKFGFKPISSTQLRMMGATEASKQLSQQDLSKVVKQMKHTPLTSQKHYQLVRGTKEAAETFQLQKKLTATGTTAEDDDESREGNGTNSQDMPDTQSKEGNSTVTSQDMPDTQSKEGNSTVDVTSQDTPESAEFENGTRRFFTHNETVTIEEYFKKEIDNLKYPKREKCLEFLSKHPIEHRDYKQIYDKVKNFIRNRKRNL